MSRLLATVLASAVLFLGGVAAADEKDSATENSATGTDQQAADTSKPESSDANAQQDQSTAQPGEASADEAEYLADVKKCEEMGGTEKTDCMDAAKKKAGRM